MNTLEKMKELFLQTYVEQPLIELARKDLNKVINEEKEALVYRVYGYNERMDDGSA